MGQKAHPARPLAARARQLLLAVTEDTLTAPAALLTHEQAAAITGAEAISSAAAGADGEAGNPLGVHGLEKSTRDASQNRALEERFFRRCG
jgi:hypothetical protein